ncbi:MAG: PAS domain S-box protein, partial [Candidatus Electrothrix sp. AR4]|nr:PAS domain S-box protein [Candidatus Electrothrix sp. AR4]
QQKIAGKELYNALEFNEKIIKEFPVGLSVYDHTGQCIASNSSMEKFIGFGEKDIFCDKYKHGDFLQEIGLCEVMKYSIKHRVNKRHQFDIIQDNGKHASFECVFVPFTLRDELRLLLMLDDISDRKKSEERLKSTLAEKEALLKEIHHRVKNNMQIVASLMFLQAQNINNKVALGILLENQNRIRSMGLVHELLYRSVDLSRVPFDEYIEALVQSLRESYDKNDVCFQIQAEGIELPVDTAVPCGLIVNELITNSFKHAFKDNHSGLLTVLFMRNDGIYTLSVSDNGTGLPDNYDWESSATLGLNLIRTLSAQLDAELDFKNDNGLTCNLFFTVA